MMMMRFFLSLLSGLAMLNFANAVTRIRRVRQASVSAEVGLGFRVGDEVVMVQDVGGRKRLRSGDEGTVKDILADEHEFDYRIQFGFGKRTVKKEWLAPKIEEEPPAFTFAEVEEEDDCDLSDVTRAGKSGMSGAMTLLKDDTILKCYPNHNYVKEATKQPTLMGATNELWIMQKTQEYFKPDDEETQCVAKSTNWVRSSAENLEICLPGNGQLKHAMTLSGASAMPIAFWTATGGNPAAHEIISAHHPSGAACLEMERLTLPEDEVIAELSARNLKKMIFEALFALLVANEEDEFRHCDINPGNMLMRESPLYDEESENDICCFRFEKPTVVTENGDVQAPQEGLVRCFDVEPYEFVWLDYDWSRMSGHHWGPSAAGKWPKYKAMEMNYGAKGSNADGTTPTVSPDEKLQFGINKCNDLHWFFHQIQKWGKIERKPKFDSVVAFLGAQKHMIDNLETPVERLNQGGYTELLLQILNDEFFDDIERDEDHGDAVHIGYCWTD